MLNKNEKHLYDQIYANAIEVDPEFNLTTKIGIERVRDVFDSVRLDNPDLFWLSTSYSYSYDDNDNVTSMTLGFYDMVNNLEDFKKTFYDCAGYSNAFQYYMQRLGIPSAVLFGDANGNHAWSLVYLDGEYYEMDVTWNDPIGNEPNTYYYDYFNITSSEIAPTRTRKEMSAKLPKANGSLYSFTNWYGSDPGRDFTSIKYGNPKLTLPHLYPEY